MTIRAHHCFAGRTLGIATMHGKECVIGPALMARLPLAGAAVIPDLDTDVFGTFSGDVPRPSDPLTTCTAKARQGIARGGFDLVIASEGSVVPYPPAPLIACDEEWLVLVDARGGRVFHHRHVSLRVMHSGAACETVAQAMEQAGRMGFPDHGMIIKPRAPWQTGDPIAKGIRALDHLARIASDMLDRHGGLWIENDLRAMHNPTRMEVIRETAEAFAAELACQCPQCGAAWFRVAAHETGLPCRDCGAATASVTRVRRDCWSCSHQAFEARPDGRTGEDPQFCPDCNP